MQVILLNSDYTFLNVINWKRAVCLVVKGKVEVLKYSKKVIYNCEKTIEIVIPKILRLVKLIRTLYKSRVPFSRRNVFTRDKFRCMYCGSNVRELTIDHIIPKSRGGKTNFENCVTACFECNRKKEDKLPKEVNMYPLRNPTQPTIMEFILLKVKQLGINELLDDLCEI